MKIGILGLGQAGGKIARAIATQSSDYVPLAVNLAAQDLDGLSLPEYAKLLVRNPSGLDGSGRDPQVPKAALLHEANQSAFLERIQALFGLDTDGLGDGSAFRVQHLLIAVGAGGGTGNGFLQAVLETGMTAILPPISLVLALPAGVDPRREKINTTILLDMAHKAALSGQIGAIFTVENDKFANLDVANVDFARRFHTVVSQTSVKSEVKAVDTSDLAGVLRASGFAAALVTPSLDAALGSLAASGYDVASATEYAVMIVGSGAAQKEREILDIIAHHSPSVMNAVPGIYPRRDIVGTEIYAMLSGMDMPAQGKAIAEVAMTTTTQKERFAGFDLSKLQQASTPAVAQSTPEEKPAKAKWTGFSSLKK